MLKWAFNEPRQSYLPNSSDQIRTASLNELSHMPTAAFFAQSSNTPTKQLSRWQSVDSNCLQLNKENQITSTPLLACSSLGERQLSKEKLCLRKLGSLKDLSNIYPESVNGTPRRPTHKSPPKRQHNRNASTLPTLDVNEYSPSSALVPGPLLALRGIGIPDAYFNKPRYLETTTTIAQSLSTKTSRELSTSYCRLDTERSLTKSLSSSQMDDSTLERMIDAIIASSQKETKMPNKLTRQGQAHIRPSMMTPTYTPAYDPASELDEIWWSAEQRYRQGNKASNHRRAEQLLCTPKSHKSQLLDSSFKRRRQRSVRRKRKLKSFRQTMQKSARKLLRVGSTVSAIMPQLNEADELNNEQQSHIHLSPDSGHNSSSGDSTKTEDHVGCHHLTTIDNYAVSSEVEVNKRRLNFSKNPL